jgi:hypothetical protein
VNDGLLNLKQAIPRFPGWVWNYWSKARRPIFYLRFRSEDSSALQNGWNKLKDGPRVEFEKFLEHYAQ